MLRRLGLKWWNPLLAFVLAVLVGLCGCPQQQEPGSQGAGWIEVPIDTGKAKILQEEVDNGHQPGLLDPRQVTYEFLEQELGIPGSQVQKMREVEETPEGKVLQVIFSDGKAIELVVVQPVRKERTGIWQVEKYRFLK